MASNYSTGPMLLVDHEPARSPGRRAAGAAWASAAFHAFMVIAAFWIAGRGDVIDEASAPAAAREIPLVWVEQPGRTGGLRGGLGNRQAEPAPRAERPGAGRMTVPTRAQPSFDRADERERPAQEVSIPAVPDASGLRDVPGVLSTVTLADYANQGPGSGRSAGDADGSGLNRGRHGIGDDGPGGSGSDVQPPLLVSQVRPDYTSAALMARVQGVVGIEAVVMPDGSVGEVRVIRSLDRDLGLDQQAIKAVKLWRFRPATRLGKAIPMFVSIEMTFSLR